MSNSKSIHELTNLQAIDNKIKSLVLTNKEIALQQLKDIICRLPSEIGQLVENGFLHKRIPKEYLLSSVLFAYSNAAGLAFNIKCMNYTNYANLYFALIGSRGDVKSASMDLATQPLNEYDTEHYNDYKQRCQKNNNNFEVDNQEQRKQLLIQDSTIEAAMYTHSKNKNSIGLFIDELFYLIQKMANRSSNEGIAWRTFLLQGYTNKHIDVSRKTTDSYRIEKSYPTLLGSIQHQFIPQMFANGNLESGLIDRLLFTNKLTSNDKISKDIFPYSVSSNYNTSLTNVLNYRSSIESKIIKPQEESIRIRLNTKAEEKIFKYSQDLINKQKTLTDSTNEYISKMLISIHKLTLLTHLIINANNSSFQAELTEETVDLAIMINEFYFTNFKIVLEHKEQKIEKDAFYKEIIRLAKKHNVTQKDVSKVIGISKGHMSRLWDKYK